MMPRVGKQGLCTVVASEPAKPLVRDLWPHLSNFTVCTSTNLATSLPEIIPAESVQRDTCVCESDRVNILMCMKRFNTALLMKAKKKKGCQ